MSHRFLLTALGYFILGMILGIVMSASTDHTQRPTHAHVMLLGGAISFVYAVIYKLWLDNPQGILIKLQFYTHQLGALGISLGLYFMYSKILETSAAAPILAISSILALSSMIMMKIIYLRYRLKE